MKPKHALFRLVGGQPDEFRIFILSFFGAFLTLGFMIVSRSLREALYLANFDIKTLPYIIGTIAFLGIPTVGIFSRLLVRHRALLTLKVSLLVVAAGLLILWPFLSFSRAAIVFFYLWTALGTMILTSGFWVVVSEYFPLRSAKRLFGLICAGGTAGAMFFGAFLKWITQSVPIFWLVPGLVGLLGLLFLIQSLVPKIKEDGKQEALAEETSFGKDFLLIWKNHHLKLIGSIVITATLASTLLDYQFKELVQNQLSTKEALAGFFGAFYGIAGAVALILQLFGVSRILGAFGIGRSLAVLPVLLLLGSAVFFIFPSIFLVTLTRGADYSLRKSLHRSVMEVLFVPLPSILRRKTKTLIDSVLDSLSAGLGAVLIFFWVTLFGFSSSYLSLFIVVLAANFLWMSGKMQRQYHTTLVERLKEGSLNIEDGEREVGLLKEDLFSVTLSRSEITSHFRKMGLDLGGAQTKQSCLIKENNVDDIFERLKAPEMSVILKALEENREWGASHLEALARLLARDPLSEAAAEVLIGIGDIALPCLGEKILDESADFVIRRRIPRILAEIDNEEADQILLNALLVKRFEIRYRSAVALIQRRKNGLKTASGNWHEKVWEAIRFEVGHAKPVWEAQVILDESESQGEKDDLVARRVSLRGELSLEHTFRMLTLVLNSEPVRTAFAGILSEDEKLKSLAIEYLEQVLPLDIRQKLWPFIGDLSDYQKKRAARPLDHVVADLLKTGESLFQSPKEKDDLKRALKVPK